MERHSYLVVIDAPNRDKAEQVINERTDFDEDLGFDYQIISVSHCRGVNLNAEKA